jgi:hypothetical protein
MAARSAKTLDDGYEATRAAENTKKLINEERVFALFGYVGTPTSAASMPIFTEAKVPFVGPFTGAESLRNPVNPLIFNVRASYYEETEAIVQHLTAMSVDRIAVFYQNDAYGQAGLAGVERALKKRNLPIIAKGTVERNTVDVKKAVAEINKANPQAVVMISAYKSCAAYINDTKAAGQNPTFWNVSSSAARLLQRSSARKAAASRSRGGAVPLGMVRCRGEGAQRAMKAEPGFARSGPIAAKVMVEGLRRRGATTRELCAPWKASRTSTWAASRNYGPGNRSGRGSYLTIILKDQSS